MWSGADGSIAGYIDTGRSCNTDIIAAGIPLGILAGEKDTWMDTSAVFASVPGISAPSFFMGIVIAYLFGFVLERLYTGLPHDR